MKLTINGQPRDLPDGPLNVAGLLRLLELDVPVLVELNGVALLQREFSQQPLSDGDRVELFRMVAGG